MNILEAEQLLKSCLKETFCIEIEDLKEAIKIILKDRERVTEGRNFLSKHFLAKEFTPELLDKCLTEKYISKDKIRQRIDELAIEILNYNKLAQREVETDVEYYDNILNCEVKKMLEQLLEEEKLI